MRTPTGRSRLEHGQHSLFVERLEIEPVGGVVVGRDSLRIAVDHHGLEALSAETLGGVDAAVVELDPLPNPVRATAQDDHRTAGLRALLVGLAAGRVEVIRARVDLTGARVDPAVGDGAASAAASSSSAANHGCRFSGCHSGSTSSPRFALANASDEIAADSHRFADRFHLRAERPVGARKLLAEGEARELDDDVVERCRLEARRRRPGQIAAGSRRACSRPRAWRSHPAIGVAGSLSRRAPTSARRVDSSRSRAVRRLSGGGQIEYSTRRCRRRPP